MQKVTLVEVPESKYAHININHCLQFKYNLDDYLEKDM